MEEQKLERRITEELVALSEYSIESKAPLQCVRIMGIIRAHTSELLEQLKQLKEENERMINWLWQYREEMKSTNVFHKNQGIINQLNKLLPEVKQ